MSGGIFLLHADDHLVEMTERAYDSERLLQELLESHPALLSGDQIDPESPRRWLLVNRETSVPSQVDGGSRWSLDHLFIDQDGISTLIEVKRSTDTRIRREVVGQMLDYAANAVVYWPVEALQAALRERCTRAGLDADQAIAAVVGPTGDADAFWPPTKTTVASSGAWGERSRWHFLVNGRPAAASHWRGRLGMVRAIGTSGEECGGEIV